MNGDTSFRDGIQKECWLSFGNPTRSDICGGDIRGQLPPHFSWPLPACRQTYYRSCRALPQGGCRVLVRPGKPELAPDLERSSQPLRKVVPITATELEESFQGTLIYWTRNIVQQSLGLLPLASCPACFLLSCPVVLICMSRCGLL